MPETYNPNNILAKILRDEIPSARVYEDQHAIAFMDVMPQAPGHTLVIPRDPSRDLLDAKPETLSALVQAAQKVAQGVKKAMNADGITLMQFNGAAAGQTIFHLHFHIIPRFEGTPLKSHAGDMADMRELEDIAARIREAVKKL
ncbi:MAG: HIT family hydrolase [Candidatus Tokpelaia hoelldobleri]|uniref:HIT family hydrolase n=1 Tax=Candidatus Tokpelaia hoelldobleri TaxID=1902579 RepID=A0A1U9JUA2_9HYPH|nr:MAG: HIT family hydrolase [Candidatus Tokpelaia hoelldoblerii]